MKKIFQLFILKMVMITSITLTSCYNKTSIIVNRKIINKPIVNRPIVREPPIIMDTGSLIGTWKFVYRSGKKSGEGYEEGKNVNNGKVDGTGQGGKDGGDSSIVTITFNSDGTYIAKYLKSVDINWKSAQAENDSGATFMGRWSVIKNNDSTEEGGTLVLNDAGMFNLGKLDTTADIKNIQENGKNNVVYWKKSKDQEPSIGSLQNVSTLSIIREIILIQLGYIKVPREKANLIKGLREASPEKTDNDTVYIKINPPGRGGILKDILRSINYITGIPQPGIPSTQAAAEIVEGLDNLERLALRERDPERAWKVVTDALEAANKENDRNKIAEKLMVTIPQRKAFTSANHVKTALEQDKLKNMLADGLQRLLSFVTRREEEKERVAQRTNKPNEAGMLNKFSRLTQQLAFARKKAANSNTEDLTKGELYSINKLGKNKLILNAKDKNYFTFDTSSKREDSGVELKFERVVEN